MYHFLKFVKPSEKDNYIFLQKNTYIPKFLHYQDFFIKKHNYFKINFFFKKNLRYYYNFRFNRLPAYSFSNDYKFKFFTKKKILKNAKKYQMITALKFLYNIYLTFFFAIKNLELLIFFFTLNFVFFNNIKILFSFFFEKELIKGNNLFFNFTNTYYNARYGKKMNSLKRRRKKILLKKINYLKNEANDVEQKVIF